MISGKERDFRDYNPFCVNFLFKEHWEGFRVNCKSVLRDVEVREVEKMLLCKDESRGFWTCYCKSCGEYHDVFLGCNSRLCSCCGKRYADGWAEALVERIFDVLHKHVVFGLPPLLWFELRRDRKAWRVVMDAVIETMEMVLWFDLW